MHYTGTWFEIIGTHEIRLLNYINHFLGDIMMADETLDNAAVNRDELNQWLIDKKQDNDRITGTSVWMTAF